jgi:hypothetical protein
VAAEAAVVVVAVSAVEEEEEAVLEAEAGRLSVERFFIPFGFHLICLFFRCLTNA